MPEMRIPGEQATAYVMGQEIDLVDDEGTIVRTVEIVHTGLYTWSQLMELPDHREWEAKMRGLAERDAERRQADPDVETFGIRGPHA